jgi:hypothetical protein
LIIGWVLNNFLKEIQPLAKVAIVHVGDVEEVTNHPLKDITKYSYKPHTKYNILIIPTYLSL